LEAAPGPKYKAARNAAYGAGLRVSEVVAVKVSDVDSKRMLLRIEQGKGRKDASQCSPHNYSSCCVTGGRSNGPGVGCFQTRQPVLILFEDVHWSDPTTRELLDLLIELVPPSPSTNL
jgi:hypothetical protein